MKDLLKKLKRRTNLVFGTVYCPHDGRYGNLCPVSGAVSSDRRCQSAVFRGTAQPPVLSSARTARGAISLSRVIYGARISLSVGTAQPTHEQYHWYRSWASPPDISASGGTIWSMGLTNIMLSIPAVIFALAIMALLGPGLINVFIALWDSTNWSYTCRITRSASSFHAGFELCQGRPGAGVWQDSHHVYPDSAQYRGADPGDLPPWGLPARF